MRGPREGKAGRGGMQVAGTQQTTSPWEGKEKLFLDPTATV